MTGPIAEPVAVLLLPSALKISEVLIPAAVVIGELAATLPEAYALAKSVFPKSNPPSAESK